MSAFSNIHKKDCNDTTPLEDAILHYATWDEEQTYFEEAKLAAAEYANLQARVRELEEILRSAPNPYSDEFELSRYKGWYVTDRVNTLPIKRDDK